MYEYNQQCFAESLFEVSVKDPSVYYRAVCMFKALNSNLSFKKNIIPKLVITGSR